MAPDLEATTQVSHSLMFLKAITTQPHADSLLMSPIEPAGRVPAPLHGSEAWSSPQHSTGKGPAALCHCHPLTCASPQSSAARAALFSLKILLAAPGTAESFLPTLTDVQRLLLSFSVHTAFVFSTHGFHFQYSVLPSGSTMPTGLSCVMGCPRIDDKGWAWRAIQNIGVSRSRAQWLQCPPKLGSSIRRWEQGWGLLSCFFSSSFPPILAHRAPQGSGGSTWVPWLPLPQGHRGRLFSPALTRPQQSYKGNNEPGSQALL